MSRLENHSPGPNLTIGGRDYVLFVSQGQNLLFVLALARASVGLSEAYRHAMEQPPSGTGPNSSGKSSALGESQVWHAMVGIGTKSWAHLTSIPPYLVAERTLRNFKKPRLHVGR